MIQTIPLKNNRVSLPKNLREVRSVIPTSWKKAAGLLRHKRVALQNHLRQVRLEWNRK